MPATPPQPGNLPKLEDGYGPTPVQKQAMATASNQAKATGKPVVVSALTTETGQVVANPAGGFTLAANPQPVRTQQRGSWVPIDTTLHTNPDGTVSPAATAYATVTLSGGGRGPLATTTAGPTTYSVSWPAPLPTPRVSGSTATYPNVLPGVDLVVSATRAGGFSDVLVVKDATAAKNPALAGLALESAVVGGQVRTGAHGNVSIASKGGMMLDAGTPRMWDSNTSLTAEPSGKATARLPAEAKVAADASDAGHPGMAARVAPVQTHATNSSLTLTPDTHLLTSASTVYPVYIDPNFNWHPTTGGTPAFDEVKQGAPCANTSFYNNSGPAGDNGNLGVGYNNWDSCVGVERTYYQWQLPPVIWGAHIGNAGSQPGATVNVSKVYSASCSTTSTDYLHWTGGIGAGTSWNNQPGPAPTIGQAGIGPAFNPTYCPGNGSVAAGFDVTGPIASAAANHASQFTVSLTGNEAPGNLEFSRFADNPTLQIFYNLIPNTPGPLAAVAGSDNLGCATTAPYPYLGKTIAANPPVLTATVSDPDADQLRASFKYWIDGSPTTYTGTSADNLGSGTTANYSLPSSFTSALSNGQVVDWQVQATDGQDWSAWSPVCHFIAEPTAPSEPSISSADGAFPNDGHTGRPANTPGQFTEASTGGTVSKLVKALDQAPPTNNPPAADTAPFTGGGVITPAGRWKLADGSGTTATDSVGTHPATLTGGANWTNDATRGEVLTLNGTSGAATTAAPVVKTDGSFTVSAWVNLTSNSGYQTFVAQQGSTASGFYLEYDSDVNQWTFARFATDSTATPIRARASSTVTLNTWTHLAGVYDAASGTMTIYVNGAAAGTATDTTPWNATGPLVIGRGYTGAANNWVHGSVSDVQLYQAALSAKDISYVVQPGGLVQPTGRWRLLDATGNTATDTSGANHPATLNGGYTWATTPTPAVTFNGTNGYAATTGPVVDTSHSFTVSAWVKPASLSGGYQTFLTQQGTTVGGFYLEYDSDVNQWTFARFATDSTSSTAIRARATTAPVANAWTHLAGSYDATSGAMTLYVNGQSAATATDTTPWNATGPLVIGRGYYGSSANNYTNGSITDVQVYKTALGGPEAAQLYASSTGAITPPSPGPHTLYSYAADPAGNVSGYQSYRFVASGDPNTTCASLAACFNNTAVSTDANHALGNIDGAGNSFSATDLANAGWTSGGHVTINGATFTLPQYGAGQADNVLAANQTIANTDPTLAAYNQRLTSTGASALEFLVTATNASTASPGAINGDTTAPYVPKGIAVAGTYCFDSTNPAAYCAPHGTISYSDGTTQTYYLTVPDWVTGPEATDAIWLPHENQSGGQASTHVKIYPFSVPLAAGKTITSVALPDVGTRTAPGAQSLHVFGIGTRNTTTAGAPSGQTWTGSWAAPTEGVFNYGTSFANQTIRETVTPSLSGGTVRLKFDDALGSDPIVIDHATVAIQSSPLSPVPTTTPTNLTFGGSRSVTLPVGGMVYSDPLTFPVTANQPLLVSFHLVNTIPYMVMNAWAPPGEGEWISASGSGDHAGDTTATAFTGTDAASGPTTQVVTNLDVATNNVPTQAVLGDGFIDGGASPAALATHNLASDLTAVEPTTPSPYGSIAEGIEANRIMTDFPNPQSNAGGPAALSRIDRDILDQPNLSAVVVAEGLEDILAGRTANDLTSNGYAQLINYLQFYGVSTIVATGLTPCDGYAGDRANPNDACTSAVDTQRTAVNTWLNSSPDYLSPWSVPALFFIDADAAIGVPDPTNGETKLNAAADGGDHVNLTDAGFGALTTAYLGAQDTWTLNDGATNTSTTQAADSANNATNPYLINNTVAGNNPATLTGAATWATDTTHGGVLALDGTSGYAATNGPVLTTTGSYTISAWVKPTTTSHTGMVVSQDGNQASAFGLYYDATTNQWVFAHTTSDTASTGNITAASGIAATAGAWTHLTGVYNATTHTLSIYVNGTLARTATDTNPWNATGPLAIGRGKYNATNAFFFLGNISNVQAWNYALTGPQVAALYNQIN